MDVDITGAISSNAVVRIVGGRSHQRRQTVKVDRWPSLMIAACLQLRLHQIRENVVNESQVAAAL